MVRPKKHLGQHFLTDQNIARKIVSHLSDKADSVIEIGAGMGVLTQYLLPTFGEKFFVVEIDEESVDYLKIHYPSLNERILLADFLKTDLKKFGESISIIGNFPYNISSQIFFHVLTHKQLVNEIVCMIQKEVAERIAAPPGSKTYGILSVLLQAWYEIEYLFTVGENVFNPPPKVKSAVIRFKRNQNKNLGCDEMLFTQIVKRGFNQRRKTLRNGLRDLLHPDVIGDEIFNKRAEQLGVSDFIKLTNMISAMPNQAVAKKS